MEFDQGTFRYLKSNKAHEQMTGMSSSQLKGKTPVEILGEKVGGMLQKSWLVRLIPIKNEDKITYLFGSRIDITELKDLKMDKDKLLKNLNSMFTEHSAVMLITDMITGKILDANPPACLFYGYSKDKILFLNLQDINEMRQNAVCKEHRYFLYCHRLKSGETKMVDVYSCPITYEGKLQLFSIIFDVSDSEKFLILLPKTNVEEAQDMIQTLETSFETNNCLPLQISVSLGFDVRQSMNEPLHQSLQKAEEQMYHKKLLAGQSYRNSIINTLLATLYEKSMEILKKPGPLDEDQWKEMKRHPEIGYRIAQTPPELSTVAEYILSHHERWDGTGYPRGLKGNEIPLLCRILAVADSYDARELNSIPRS